MRKFTSNPAWNTAEDRHKKGAVGLNQGRKQRYRRSCKLDGPNEKSILQAWAAIEQHSPRLKDELARLCMMCRSSTECERERERERERELNQGKN
eukprot:scaffold2365_cov109-Skeletonema_marinoi.AAC.4